MNFQRFENVVNKLIIALFQFEHYFLGDDKISFSLLHINIKSYNPSEQFSVFRSYSFNPSHLSFLPPSPSSPPPSTNLLPNFPLKQRKGTVKLNYFDG